MLCTLCGSSHFLLDFTMTCIYHYLHRLTVVRTLMIFYKYSSGKGLKAYTASIFLYNSSLWTLTKKLEKKIDTFQRNLLRKIFNVKWPSFGNISPRIWNDLQTTIDVNVSIVKFKSMSKIVFQGTQIENNIYKISIRKCNASLHNLFMDRHTFCIIMHCTYIMKLSLTILIIMHYIYFCLILYVCIYVMCIHMEYAIDQLHIIVMVLYMLINYNYFLFIILMYLLPLRF